MEVTRYERNGLRFPADAFTTPEARYYRFREANCKEPLRNEAV